MNLKIRKIALRLLTINPMAMMTLRLIKRALNKENILPNPRLVGIRELSIVSNLSKVCLQIF